MRSRFQLAPGTLHLRLCALLFEGAQPVSACSWHTSSGGGFKGECSIPTQMPSLETKCGGVTDTATGRAKAPTTDIARPCVALLTFCSCVDLPEQWQGHLTGTSYYYYARPIERGRKPLGPRANPTLTNATQHYPTINGSPTPTQHNTTQHNTTQHKSQPKRGRPQRPHPPNTTHNTTQHYPTPNSPTQPQNLDQTRPQRPPPCSPTQPNPTQTGRMDADTPTL